MDEEISVFIDTLESLLEDMSSKPRDFTEEIIESLRSCSDTETLLRIQDDLETLSNMSNIDNFTRNEIMNVIAEIENVVNS